jgi:hypothetical protein
MLQNLQKLVSGQLQLLHVLDTDCDNTHTHTHTHIYIYIYIYSAFYDRLLKER